MEKKRVDIDSVNVGQGTIAPEELIVAYKRLDKFELLKKIEIVSKFINDVSFDYGSLDTPEITAVIENFIATYPNKEDYHVGLEKMYGEFYLL
jgi:hypothetical protein